MKITDRFLSDNSIIRQQNQAAAHRRCLLILQTPAPAPLPGRPVSRTG